MKNRLSAIFSTIVGLMLVPPPSNAAEIACPASITESPAISQVNPEWSVVTRPGQRPLEQAGVYLAVGAEFGAQAPDATKTIGRKEELVSWRLPNSKTETFWIGCSYTGTMAMLFKKLNPDIASCIVSYTLLPTGKRQRLKSIDCN